MTFETHRQLIKLRVQTRLWMRRHSCVPTELENRALDGDR